jgi:hypothetical protein
MAYKTFVNGFPLNASELNTFLMNQSVATFANAAARTSAITAPAEGQLTYLEDDNTFYAFNGTSWVAQNFEAPRSPNYVINGGMDIWQRGTSVAGANVFRADRHYIDDNATVARSTDVPANVDLGYSLHIPATTGAASLRHAIELPGLSQAGAFSDGQTFTISFYAKSTAARDIRFSFVFKESLLSANIKVAVGTTTVGVLSSSWQRFSSTFTIAAGSITGARALVLNISSISGTSADFFYTGVQLEAGSVATPFRRNSNNLEGELAACQRYYQRLSAAGANTWLSSLGVATSTTQLEIPFVLPNPMRATPTSLDFSNLASVIPGSGLVAVTNLVLGTNTNSSSSLGLVATHASGLTSGQVRALIANNSTTAFVGFSAEL